MPPGRTPLMSTPTSAAPGILVRECGRMSRVPAVAVVSGKIRGPTTTMPLQVEMLYNEYNAAAAFALASMLALLALVTLVLKSVLEWRFGEEIAAGND